MTDRDRLIKLLNVDMSGCEGDYAEEMADYLIKNGIIVPPCKVGTRHNKLTFISVDEEKTKEKHRTYYLLRCDCGTIVPVRKDCWESGSTKACGCLYETHGQAKGEHTRLYNIYHGMKKRCYNLMSKSYKDYGGRGYNQSHSGMILISDGIRYRYLSNAEAELAMTLPVGYTDGISDKKRAKCIGNGWTIDVIAHILKHIRS